MRNVATMRKGDFGRAESRIAKTHKTILGRFLIAWNHKTSKILKKREKENIYTPPQPQKKEKKQLIDQKSRELNILTDANSEKK